MSDSLPSNDRRNWEHADSIGVFRPLSPRLVAGQTSTAGQLLQPLGMRSLTVLQPRLFLNGSQKLADSAASPFEASPFFDTTEWRSPSSSQPAPLTVSPLPSPPSLLTSAANSDGPTANPEQTVSQPLSVDPNQVGAQSSASATSPTVRSAMASEPVTATNPEAAIVQRLTSEPDSMAPAPAPSTTSLPSTHEPTSPGEPEASSSASTDFLATEMSAELAGDRSDTTASVNETDAPTIQPLAESTSKADATSLESRTPSPSSSPPLPTSTTPHNEVVQSAAPPSGLAEPAPISMADQRESDTSAVPNEPAAAAAAIQRGDDIQSDTSPPVTPPLSSAENSPPTTSGPLLQPQGQAPEAGTVAASGEGSDAIMASEASQSPPLPAGSDVQLASADPATLSPANRSPHETASVRPASDTSRASSSPALPIEEASNASPNLQRQSGGSDRLPLSPSTDLTAAPEAIVPTDRPVLPDRSNRLSGDADPASAPTEVSPESSSPDLPTGQSPRFETVGESPGIQPSSASSQSLPTPPFDKTNTKNHSTTSPGETTDSASASVSGALVTDANLQRSPTQRSSETSPPVTPPPDAATAASMTHPTPAADPGEELATPMSKSSMSAALPNQAFTPISNAEANLEASDTPLQRRANADASSTRESSTTEPSSAANDTSKNPSFTEPPAPGDAEKAADGQSASTVPPYSTASERSPSLQRFPTEAADPNLGTALPDGDISPSDAVRSSANIAVPVPPVADRPSRAESPEAVPPATTAEPIASTPPQPLDGLTPGDGVTPTDGIEITEHSSAPIQRQLTSTTEVGIDPSAGEAELRSPAATPTQQPAASSADPVPESIASTSIADQTQGTHPELGAAATLENAPRPNRFTASDATIHRAPQETASSDTSRSPAPDQSAIGQPLADPADTADPRPNSSGTLFSPQSEIADPSPSLAADLSAGTVGPAEVGNTETGESPVSDREVVIQRDITDSDRLPESYLPRPANSPEDSVTPAPLSRPTSPEVLSPETSARDATVASSSISLPSDSRTAGEAEGLSQPFLTGDKAIQQSVTLPTVMTDLSHQTLRRLPQSLFSSSAKSSPPELSQSVRESAESVEVKPRSPVAWPFTDAPAKSATAVNQLTPDARIQRSSLPRAEQQALESGTHDAMTSPSSSPPEPGNPAMPQAWDSVEDLLHQLSPSAPTSQPPAAVQRESVVAATPKTTFTNLQAAAIPVPVIQRRPATTGELPIQRLVSDPPAPDPTSTEYGLSETDTSGSETSGNLEKLATVMYQMVRQRFAIERERFGRTGSSRF